MKKANNKLATYYHSRKQYDYASEYYKQYLKVESYDHESRSKLIECLKKTDDKVAEEVNNNN